jgi:V8-like Glu-specific endopeptidase
MKRVARLAALCTVISAVFISAVFISAVFISAVFAAIATSAAASQGPAVPNGSLAGVPAAVSGHPAAMSARQQAGVRRYWTQARMRHAAPVRGAAVVAGGPRRAWMSGQSAAVPPTGLLGIPLTVSAVPAAAPAVPAIGLGGPQSTPQRAAAGAQSGAAQYSAATAGQSWAGGGAIARTTGKVFFTMDGRDYVCSGSTVASKNMDVVMTAGHCVKDPVNGWATNWTFVPGYSDGNAPYGSYTARQFYLASAWSTQGNNDYDVAFVTVNPAPLNGAQVPVVREVGGQGIAFGRRPAQEIAFGYPSDAPYDGQQLYYCGGATSPDPYHETSDSGLRCALTAGTSGGPWLSGFNPAAGTGVITSVSSFKYSTSAQILYGTPLGSTARSLYESAQS